MATASYQLQLQLPLAQTIGHYANVNCSLESFYASLDELLKASIANGMFPCHYDKISQLLTRLSKLSLQASSEPLILAITGSRALLALNSLIFQRAVLDDNVFFRGRTLFMIDSQLADDGALVRLQVYSKGKLDMHKELRFDCLQALNERLSTELTALESSQDFDGLAVEISLHCPLMSKFKVAAVSTVDAVTKELLESVQNQCRLNSMSHHLCLMMHCFAPNISTEADRIAAESELKYVCRMVPRNQLLLICEHLKSERDRVAASVQKYTGHSVSICYYFQWQSDGLESAQRQLETMLQAQLHQRSNQLVNVAVNELKLPLKIAHQIKRSINLCKSVSNNQKRPKSECLKDFSALSALAERQSDSFRRMIDREVRNVSDLITRYLNSGPVKLRIVRAITNRSSKLQNCSDEEMEFAFLEVIAEEIRQWNDKTEALNRVDEALHKAKTDKAQELCSRASSISEIILVSNDVFTSTVSSTLSQHPEAGVSMSSFLDDMVRRRVRASKLESFVTAVSSPLWVPLALITVLITATVVGTKRRAGSHETFQEELLDKASDFLNRLDKNVFWEQFFEQVRKRLNDDANRLREFVEHCCILPADHDLPVTSRYNDQSFMSQLSELERQLHSLQGGLMMLQVEKLGRDVLSRGACRQLGIDMDVDDWETLGAQLELTRKKHYLVAPQPANQGHLVLKMAATRSESQRLLLEIDILKSVSVEHSAVQHIVPWIATVFFPRLSAIGFLMNKYDCDLWEFLQNHELSVVPYKQPPNSSQRDAAFAVCRNTCEQVFAGVDLLHSKLILHRNLSLENIMIELQQQPGGQTPRIVARLSDFGLAKYESEMSGATRGCTDGYMAPEVQQTNPLFSDKSDIYALGVIAWECFFGQRIFAQTGALRVLKSGNQRWDYLIESMTCQLAMNRPLMKQCRAMLRQMDKELQSSPLQPIPRALPSLKESEVLLSSTKKGL